MTYVAYYGDRDEMEWVQGAPEGKSTVGVTSLRRS